MARFQSTSISFVPKPRWNNQVSPSIHLPQQRHSIISMPNREFKTQSTNSSKKLLKILPIFFGIVGTISAAAIVALSTYRYLNIETTTTTTTTSTTSTTTTTTTSTTTTTTSLPSQCYSYTTINDASRQVTYGSGSISDTTWLGLGSRWVRFIGASGTELATYSYGAGSCGTYSAGYYISALPSPSNTVSGIMCYAYSTHSCYFTDTILVTNCGSYYVYLLNSPPYNPGRYCTM